MGIVILVSEVQPSKAKTPILVTELGIVTLVSEVQPEKALNPILITELEIVTFESLPLYFIKILAPSITKSFG